MDLIANPTIGSAEMIHDSGSQTIPFRAAAKPMRRSRRICNKHMLEMLKALARSHATGVFESELQQQDAAPPTLAMPEPPTPRREAAVEPEVRPTYSPGGLALLNRLFNPQPVVEDELECAYCGAHFHLHEGGALFEGRAACVGCEQHLTREVVTTKPVRTAVADAGDPDPDRRLAAAAG